MEKLNMNKNVLSVNDLRIYYKTRLLERIYAVDGVSLELEEGRVLGVAGESGCGKSTLAVSLMGLYDSPLHYDSGEIIIGNNDITKIKREDLRVNILGKRIAYIPQSAMNALNPTLRIKSFIFDVMKEHCPDMTREEVYKMASDRFTSLNLPIRALESYPNELSGGMKQRTVIAISTMMNPEILVADEPTSALDVSSQKVVMKMLKSLMEKGIVKSMILITHELPLLYHIADDIMVMYAGEAVEIGTADEIVFDPLHPYSKALMTSIVVPEVGIKDQKLCAIAGAPPNLKNKIEGCRFADRCKNSTVACEAGTVVMKKQAGRAYRCHF